MGADSNYVYNARYKNVGADQCKWHTHITGIKTRNKDQCRKEAHH